MFAFYDVIINKICWVDTTDMSLIKKLMTFETFNYKGYPIRLTLFERNPTLLPEKKLPLQLLPEFFRVQAEKMNGYSGMDALIMSYVADRLNVTYSFQIYNTSDYGLIDRSGRSFGTLGKYSVFIFYPESQIVIIIFPGDIVKNKTDIAINTRFIKFYGNDEKTDFLSPVFADRLCIITPKAQPVPRWKAPLLIFTPYAWFGIFIMILFSSWFLTYLKRWEDS